jgi:DNA processing protein
VAAVTRPPDDVLEPLVRAVTLPGVGVVRLGRALRSAAGPRPGLESLIREAEAGLGANDRTRAAGWARRALETIRRDQIHVLVRGLTPYPPALLPLERPPLAVFGRGRLELLDRPMVAVVGTRGMSPYGRDAAHRIAAGIAASGAIVVSGLARGVDGVAHRAAGPARTVAVLGCGIDVVFPKAHADLQAAIGREGLLLSEQPPGTPPARHRFPLRNRLIAALARAVVVVEAPPMSGALSTAARARDQGRDVFAVPGPIGARGSLGTNALIRDGATLVTSAREVLAALGLPTPSVDEAELPPPDLEGQALALWRALDGEPRHAEEVAARAGLDPQRGLSSLLALEIRGHARQLAGLRFARA